MARLLASRAEPCERGGMADTDPVTVVVTRIIKPGCEDAFRAWVDDVRTAVAKYPGYKGLTLHAPRTGEDRWVIVYAFDTGAHLDAWLDSDERARWVARAEALAEGGYTHAAFSGMEPFFALPGAAAPPSPPPKWKMAVITAAVVWPLSQVLGYAVKLAMPDVGASLRGLIVTAVMVALLTWVVMPQLTRWLAPWLFRASTQALTQRR